MFKYSYAVTYRLRPNKKSPGSECMLKMTTGGNLDQTEEQRKVLLVLAKIHRVNLDAIELRTYTLVERKFAPKKWLGDRLMALLKRIQGWLMNQRSN